MAAGCGRRVSPSALPPFSPAALLPTHILLCLCLLPLRSYQQPATHGHQKRRHATSSIHHQHTANAKQDQVLQRSFTQESLTALAASPNGAYLAAGGNSGSLYVWDTATGALLRSWPAHYKVGVCVCVWACVGIGGEWWCRARRL